MCPSFPRPVLLLSVYCSCWASHTHFYPSPGAATLIFWMCLQSEWSTSAPNDLRVLSVFGDPSWALCSINSFTSQPCPFSCPLQLLVPEAFNQMRIATESPFLVTGQGLLFPTLLVTLCWDVSRQSSPRAKAREVAEEYPRIFWDRLGSLKIWVKHDGLWLQVWGLGAHPAQGS